MLSPSINMAINKYAGKILLPSVKIDFSLESRTHERSEITSFVLLAARAGCSSSFFSAKFSEKTSNVGFHNRATRD